MEFWGVEVKAGETLKVRPELFKLIHVSQAAIGEVKDVKEAKNVPLRVTVGENSFVIGTLSAEDRPQLMFDLVFEKEFELSHGWKNGSVYFIGYMADDPSDEAIDSEDDSGEDEADDIILDALVKGKPEEKKVDVKKAAPVKSTSSKNANVTKVEPKKEKDSESEDDDSEDDSEDDDDVTVGSDSDGPEGMDFSDDESEEESESEEEEETPQKGAQKKRPAPVVAKGAAPVSAKKAKQATPDKSGATPDSAKQNGKPFGNGRNKQAQTPKSAGKLANNRNFGSQQKGFKGKHGKK